VAQASGRAPALQVQSLEFGGTEFKLQSHQKKQKQKPFSFIVSFVQLISTLDLPRITLYSFVSNTENKMYSSFLNKNQSKSIHLPGLQLCRNYNKVYMTKDAPNHVTVIFYL
jgi:hypothetical protein